MQIVIIAPGSRGDVQPYIALGSGLKNAGHVIRFVSHQNFESLVKSYGLDFWSVDSDVKSIVENNEMRERIEKGNFLSLMAQMAREAQREAISFAEGGLAAAQGMDAVLAGMGGLYIGLAIAEKLHLSLIQAYVVIRRHGYGKIDRSFPLIVRQDIQNSKFRFGDIVLIVLPFHRRSDLVLFSCRYCIGFQDLVWVNGDLKIFGRQDIFVDILLVLRRRLIIRVVGNQKIENIL